MWCRIQVGGGRSWGHVKVQVDHQKQRFPLFTKNRRTRKSAKKSLFRILSVFSVAASAFLRYRLGFIEFVSWNVDNTSVFLKSDLRQKRILQKQSRSRRMDLDSLLSVSFSILLLVSPHYGRHISCFLIIFIERVQEKLNKQSDPNM